MLILKGKTQKGKNRVRELGEAWRVLETTDSVVFSPQSGPWAMIVPINGDQDKARWVHLSNDADFEVTVTH